MVESILGMLTGLIAVVGTLLLILAIVVVDNKSRRQRMQLLHAERMAALEKGLPVPVDYPETKKQRRPYVRGMVFMAVGIGLSIMGFLDYFDDAAHNDTELIGIAVIPFLIGLSLIIADKLSLAKGRDSSG